MCTFSALTLREAVTRTDRVHVVPSDPHKPEVRKPMGAFAHTIFQCTNSLVRATRNHDPKGTDIAEPEEHSTILRNALQVYAWHNRQHAREFGYVR